MAMQRRLAAADSNLRQVLDLVGVDERRDYYHGDVGVVHSCTRQGADSCYRRRKGSTCVAHSDSTLPSSLTFHY